MARVAMYTCKREIFHCAYVTCGSHLYFFCFFFELQMTLFHLWGSVFIPLITFVCRRSGPGGG